MELLLFKLIIIIIIIEPIGVLFNFLDTNISCSK